MESDNETIHTQRLIIHKVLNCLESCEDISTLMNILDFFIKWSSKKNKALYLHEKEII